ncbi:MAG: glycosyltransferase family 39 protein [Candidatus Omnitrophica bacterium]|nr:glycosyltransferase family 39 protein [Candidatus Omnitrophota bacterium]
MDTKRFLNRYGMFLAVIVSFLAFLPACNKFWAPYDEGFILEASRMAAKGMVPYKDFFILMYPPGQIYTLAGLFSIFGTSLAAGRIYTIFLQSIITACVFYAVKKFSGLLWGIVAFIICVSTLASLGRAIPRPTWPGIALSLLAVLFLLSFIDKEKYRHLMCASFFTGLSVIFRHDIGILTFSACLAGLSLYTVYKFQEGHIAKTKVAPKALQLYGIYSIFPFLFIVTAIFMLYKAGAYPDVVKSLIIFPREFLKGAYIPFPAFSFDVKSIFYGGCLFIEKNRFYIPIITYAATAILIFAEFVPEKKLTKRCVSLVTLLFLGIFYMQQVMVRADDGHLASASAPFIILFGIIPSFKVSRGKNPLKAFKVLVMIFLSFLMALFVFKNTEELYKHFYKRAYVKKTINPVTFGKSTVYIPDDTRDEFLSLMRYVEQNTDSNDTIYIGSLNHSVPQYGRYELIYFLTGRTPGVKYYEIHPGLQDKKNIQEEMILSLEKSKPRVLLLRDFKTNAARPGPLDKYIRKVYKRNKIIGSYHIYEKE